MNNELTAALEAIRTEAITYLRDCANEGLYFRTAREASAVYCADNFDSRLEDNYNTALETFEAVFTDIAFTGKAGDLYTMARAYAHSEAHRDFINCLTAA